MTKYDVAVLGGGPGGYVAAIRCAQYGLKTVLIEARELGGTCLNRGCIPTKTLLHNAEIYESAQESIKHGLITGTISYDYEAISERKNRVVNKLRKGIANLEKVHGVEVIKGFGVLQNPHTINVDGTLVNAEKIILATGSAPAHLPIPGIDSENIVTSDELLSMTQCPDSFVIIGGGVIGIEFATLYATLGKQVTVIEMMQSILPGVDSDIVRMLTHNLQRRGVKIITSAKVTSFESGNEIKVNYEHNGQVKTSTAACCIISVGRKPMTDGIGLENLGVRLSGSFVEVDNRLRTNIPNIYAIGDITGKIQLAHVATAQGLVAAANCAGKDESMDYSIVPTCIYTSPEIAYVGMTEEQAKQAGKAVKCGKFNVAGNGKVMAMGAKNGISKLITDEVTGEILGVHLFAPRATEMITELCVAMKCEGTIEELASTIHPHPTVSEVIMEAAHDVDGLCCHSMPKKVK